MWPGGRELSVGAADLLFGLACIGGTSVRFLGEDLWAAVEELASQPGPRRVAVAYLSSDERLRLRRGDVAIVNASDEAIRGGQTAVAVLEAAGRAGVELYCNARLHAKVIITPGAVLTGSANLSRNSPTLAEAGVLSADEWVRAAADAWWDQLLRRSIPIDAAFLARIGSLPVERRGGGRGGGRGGMPTLSEALEGELSVLGDYLYGWYEQAGRVGRQVAAREAGRRGLLPPRIPSRSWTWYEWQYEPGLLKRVRGDCQGKPSVDLRAVTDAYGRIVRFVAVEPKASNFIGAFRVSGRGYDAVVMVALRQNAPGLRLSGAAWRRQLAGRLTRGLEECPDLARRISNRPTNLIRVSELLALYRAGR